MSEPITERAENICNVVDSATYPSINSAKYVRHTMRGLLTALTASLSREAALLAQVEQLELDYAKADEAAKRIGAKWRANEAEKVALMDLVRSAYSEGFTEGSRDFTTHKGGKVWTESNSYAALKSPAA